MDNGTVGDVDFYVGRIHFFWRLIFIVVKFDVNRAGHGGGVMVVKSCVSSRTRGLIQIFLWRMQAMVWCLAIVLFIILVPWQHCWPSPSSAEIAPSNLISRGACDINPRSS